MAKKKQAESQRGESEGESSKKKQATIGQCYKKMAKLDPDCEKAQKIAYALAKCVFKDL